MAAIGLTGSTGSLGKTLLKISKQKINCYRGDVKNKKEVFEWIKKNKLQIIIHLAAIVPIKEVNKNKSNARDVNYYGTKNIVDACIKNKVKCFFFSSTSHVYLPLKKLIDENSTTKPYSYYGKIKLDAENYIIKNFKKNDIDYCIGRIFSTANADQKKNYLVPDLKRKIRKAKNKITLKNLNHYRDFISMSDLSKIILFLLSIKFKGIINLGSGKKIYLKDIAIVIGKKYKKKINFEDNKISTHLIANIKKLRKIYKKKIHSRIENIIF